MGKLYNFVRLITKYSVDFEFVAVEKGGYSGGRYIEGEETVTQCRGAIVPMAERKIYQSGGLFTQKDRDLYMFKPLPAEFTTGKVRYKGNEYKIEQETNYEDYADVYVYNLKWVSSFDRSDTE